MDQVLWRTITSQGANEVLQCKMYKKNQDVYNISTGTANIFIRSHFILDTTFKVISTQLIRLCKLVWCTTVCYAMEVQVTACQDLYISVSYHNSNQITLQKWHNLFLETPILKTVWNYSTNKLAPPQKKTYEIDYEWTKAMIYLTLYAINAEIYIIFFHFATVSWRR